jgi:hypothetical protein
MFNKSKKRRTKTGILTQAEVFSRSIARIYKQGDSMILRRARSR